VICDLAETKSFTKTAQINEVTQSAVSQAISAVEEQFKVLLIERSKKNFRLTTEGELFYEHSKQILELHEAMQSEIQELQGIFAGNIRISTVYSIGLYELPPYVQQFMRDYPEVNINVQYRRANKVYDDVLGNVADLGLVAFPVPHPKLETAPFRQDLLALACHPEHPLAKLKTVKVKALAGQKFIGFEPDIPTRKPVDKILKAQGVEAKYVMQFDNIETVKSAVEIGSGIAILPEETIRREVANHTLAMVRLDGKYFRPLAILTKKGKALSSPMKKFVEFLKTSI